MKYFLLLSSIFLLSAQFDNFSVEIFFSAFGGIGLGLTLKHVKEKAYHEGFRDGRKA